MTFQNPYKRKNCWGFVGSPTRKKTQNQTVSILKFGIKPGLLLLSEDSGYGDLQHLFIKNTLPAFLWLLLFHCN